MSVPVGLQLNNPGQITVQGGGHNAQLSDSLQVTGLTLGTRGLQLQPGKTLALVAGGITLDGGLLSAPRGRIELGSISSGSVTLNLSPPELRLSYANGSSFSNTQIINGALASTSDLSGGSGGAIQIQGKQVNIQDGSLILVQNRSGQIAGDIAINATEYLHITGKSPDFNSSSSLINETISSGAAGNIIINTPQLNVEQGGYILNRTFSTAPAGNITINTDQIEVNGFASGDASAFRAVSQIVAASFGRGKGGDIFISTQNFSISAGANVAARPYSFGNGGDITVKADNIDVDGTGSPIGNYFSLLSAATFGFANAGNLKIDTRTLSVAGGGRVSASSILFGNAGSVTINASKSIDVNGIKNAQNPSYIGAAVIPVFGFPQVNSGNTILNTPVLNISNGATVFVKNFGSGQAGILSINVNNLYLDNKASITASTRSGEGGNIHLQVRDLLLIGDNSIINAEARGSGNGGNITINAPIIVGLENSDIIANATQGNGGKIDINTQGLFGLKYRSHLTSDSDITASSQFGINGAVDINNIGVDPNSGLVELPTKVTDSSQQITTGCSPANNSRFSFTGRGGVPENPQQQVMSDRAWKDVRDLSAYRKNNSIITEIAPDPEVLILATSWYRHPNGKIELIATKSSMDVQKYLNCDALIKN